MLHSIHSLSLVISLSLCLGKFSPLWVPQVVQTSHAGPRVSASTSQWLVQRCAHDPVGQGKRANPRMHKHVVGDLWIWCCADACLKLQDVCPERQCWGGRAWWYLGPGLSHPLKLTFPVVWANAFPCCLLDCGFIFISTKSTLTGAETT